MRVFKYLKHAKGAVILIICLLLVQAMCDLALPNFTSQIVDVGIQQAGIEHAATDEMSSDTYDDICALLSQDDEATFKSSYDETNSHTYKLNAYGKQHQTQLDKMVALPLVLIHDQTQMPDLNFREAIDRYHEGNATKEELFDLESKAKDQLDITDDAQLNQQAIVAARSEYESLGYNLSDMQMGYLARVGLLMLGLAALGMVVAICIGFIASRTAARIGAMLREQLFTKVVSFSEAEIQQFSAASLITRSTNDVQLVQMVIVITLRMVLFAPIVALGGIFMIVYTNPAMGWIVALAVVAVMGVVLLLMRIAMPKFKIMQTLIDKVNLVAREILTGLPVIRAFDRQEFEESRFDLANTQLMRTQLFTNRVMTFMMPAMMLLMNGVSVLIVWVGGFYVDNGVIQTGDLIAFITYAMVIIMSFLMIGMVSIMLPRADVAAGRINEVLACQPTITDSAHALQADIALNDSLANTFDAKPAGIEVRFDKVSFRYADTSECVLEDLSFVAEPGQTTAIIGSTGSGKTTIIKLIERFFDVSSGAILLNGIDVRDVSQATLRSQIGYVPQTAFLFGGTIATNVAYRDENMDAAQINTALDWAQATEFVSSKQDGINAEISQGGTNVSGGQRQRISIARALATPASIYLFDDCFSALDYKTDAALRHELAVNLGDVTKIVVAQRVATIMSANKIIVLDDGRIVGQGTHKELLEQCAEYREIAQSQLSEAELFGGESCE